MEEIMSYIKPELLTVVAALYFVGVALEQAEIIKEKYLPLVLGIAGVLLCAIWVFASCGLKTRQDIAMAVFASIVQGILVAGMSTYVHQLFKKNRKDE
ncbi:MAG: phage holin family protein [Faecalimonas sp.]|nr:phage holin family protein [Faecalimonas sp.]